MKVLVITTKSPYPLNEGRALRTFNLLREMAREHELHLISFVQDELDVQGIDTMRGLCAEVRAVPLYLGRTAPLQLARDLLLEPFSPYPVQVLKYWTRPMRTAIAELRRAHDYDMVHLDMVHLGPYMDLLSDLPVLLMEHNVEAQILARRADNQRHPLKTSYLRYQQRKLETYETRACKQAGTVVAVSDADAQQLAQMTGRADIVCVPNGVDTDFFQPKAGRVVAEPPTLIYVGGFTWFPNLDAITYFCADILPLVQQQVPGVRLKVIGRYPHNAQVDALRNHPAVELCGLVDDIRPHVHAAAVYIVPLRIGGGTRLKILDALAMGQAIVSTSIGCEGLEVTHQHDIVIADAPQQFADSVVALIKSPLQTQALGRAGRDLVLQRYDWRAVGQGLARAYRRTAAPASTPPASDREPT